MASGAIESVAENLTDCARRAGAVLSCRAGCRARSAYRVHQHGRRHARLPRGPLEYFGKVAARLDDPSNLVPARLAALSVVVGAALTGERRRGSHGVPAARSRRTASPNAGWTMAAMAGALGVRPREARHYRLGAGDLPGVGDIERSLRVGGAAACVSLGGWSPRTSLVG